MEEVIKIPSDKTEEKLGMYADMLFRICFVMLKNENDAEDAVQNTFLKYINKAPEFESPEHEKAWLLRVTEEPNTADYRDLEISVVDKHNEVLSNTE